MQFKERFKFLPNLGRWVCIILAALLLLGGVTYQVTAAKLITSIETGINSYPYRMAVNPVTNKIYVANYNNANVTVIDGATHATQTVPTGLNPIAVAVNPVTNKIYVANYGNSNVTVIDGATNGSQTIAAGSGPYAIAVNPVTNKIYVCNTGSKSVTVIDGADNSITDVTVGTNPKALAVNPVNGKVYVANFDDDNISVIDGSNTVCATLTAGDGPIAVAVDPVYNKIYVANYFSNNFTSVDGPTNGVTNLAAGTRPYAIAVNPVTHQVYVANQGDDGNFGNDTVTVVDGVSWSSATVTVGDRPHSLVINPLTNQIFVASSRGYNITVINGNDNTTSTVSVDCSNLEFIVVNPVTNKVYASNYGGSYVAVIDGDGYNTAPVTTGNQSGAIAINPVTAKIYVANCNTNNVTIIDGASNSTATVSVGNYPSAIAVNPITNKIYVANRNSTSVTIINGATDTVITTKTVGAEPVAIAVNPVTNKIYVVNYGGTYVSEIDGDSNNIVGAPSTSLHSYALKVNPKTNKIYVINLDNTNVSVINRATNATTTVAVGSNPSAIALNPVSNKIYVTNQDDNSVSVIDGESDVIETTLTVGDAPGAIEVNPVTNKVYVANYSSNNLTVIDGATNETSNVAVEDHPRCLAVNPATNKIYVCLGGSNIVKLIDGVSESMQTITTGSLVEPVQVEVNPATNKIYVANWGYETSGDNKVTVIKEQNTVSVPLTVSITPETNQSRAYNFSASSSMGTTVRSIYYQVDTLSGTWTRLDGASGVGVLPELNSGMHILYAFAGDGQDASSVNLGGTLIGDITSYAFLALPKPPAPYMDSTQDSGISNEDDITYNTTPMLRGNVTPNATVKIYLDGSGIAAGTATGNTLGYWSWIPGSDMTNGNHTLRVTQTFADYTSGISDPFTVTIDLVRPEVIGIIRQTPSEAVTNADDLIYKVSFNEDVYGVEVADFDLTTTGSLTGQYISSVSADNGDEFNVLIKGVSGDGTLNLYLRDSATITDTAGNSIFSGFSSGEGYTVDNTRPTVVSINRLDPVGSTTYLSTLEFRVTFSEAISGVNTTDFSLTKGGTAVGTISAVSASSGTVIDVTVSSVSGIGSIKLNLNSSSTGISDNVGNPINGGFTTGQIYTIEHKVPTPTLTPGTNSYDTMQNVTVDCALSGVTIRYTTDGTTPTTSSKTISNHGTLAIKRSLTLKVKAWKSGWTTSGTMTASYTIRITATPTFSLAPGTYTVNKTTTISCATPGVTIYYTTNGDDPITSVAPIRKTYTAGSSISLTQGTWGLKAYAVKNSLPIPNSPVASADYLITGTVATPVVTPAATFVGTKDITITCSTGGARIYFTTNGDTPTESSSEYIAPGPITINSSCTLKVKAFLTNWAPSVVASVAYKATVLIPTFSPTSTPVTPYTSPQTITISSVSPSVTIRYTTNGTTPTATSPIYTTGITFKKTMTIKAMGFKTGWANSPVATGVYTADFVAAPTLSLAEGTYTTTKTTTISCVTTGATIYYTTDSSDPTDNTNIARRTYTAGSSISLTQGTRVIKACGYKATGITDPYSPVTTATYLITGTVATPVVTPAATFTGTKDITITCGTGGARIYYTTNGDTPTEGSSEYIAPGPITISSSCTVKVKAFKIDWVPSAVASVAYKATVLIPTFSPTPTPVTPYTSPQTITISSASPGVTIRYTTNGTTPTATSSIYTTGITFKKTMTIKAMGFKTGWANSPVATGVYTADFVAAPTFSLAEGTYTTTKTTTISCVTTGATIYYTTDSSDPTDNTNIARRAYTAGSSISLTQGTRVIKACGYKATGVSDPYSPVTTATYLITGTVATPVITPAATFVGTKDITITCGTTGARIYYTTNGATPIEGGSEYTTVPITISSSCTIKARAFLATWVNSAVASVEYTAKVAKPILSPASGNFNLSQAITVSCASPGGVALRYTKDGSTPTSSSPIVPAEGILVNKSMTIKVRAYKSGYATSSTATGTYTTTVATPTFTPVASTYSGAQTISVSSITPGAVLRYTTNGSTPTSSSTVVPTGGIPVSSTRTIKVKAYKTGWTTSAMAEGTYTITP